MEYIISNIKFDNCKKYKNLYYRGNFQIDGADRISIFEGFLINAKSVDYDSFEKNKGVFNNIIIDINKNEINLINDKLGQLSLYYFLEKNIFVISNSFWQIVKILKQDYNMLDIDRLKELLYFHRIPIEGETFVKGIKFLKASTTIKINYSTGDIIEKKYWNIKQKINRELTIKDAYVNLEKSFDDFFLFLKKKYPSKIFAFGNSGGLDSRLIPLFAQKHKIKLIGITIGKKKPFNILTSVSHNNAFKIAKLFGFKNYALESTTGNYKNRLLLDIKNNPLSGNQLFKNPYEQLPEFDYLICGGNGFIVSNDSNLWRIFDNVSEKHRFDFLFDYINKEKLSIPYKNIYRIKKFINISLKIDYNKSIFRQWFSNEEIDKFRSNFRNFYEEYKNFDNFSLIRQLHMSLLNKQSPNGGLESISRTKPFFYLYYPFAFDIALAWDKDFFYDRKILKEIIKKNNISLAKIPDQSMNKIVGKSGKLFRLLNIILRRSGMDYALWAKQSKFKQFAREIIERENPVFDKILETKINFNKLAKTHPHFWLDVVKIKKIADIIYYREYDFIDNKDFFIQ